MEERYDIETPEIYDDDYLTKELDNDIANRPLYHEGIVKNNMMEAADDISNEWAGGSPFRSDRRLQDIARLEHDIRHIKGIEAPRMAASILAQSKMGRITEQPVQGQTTYTTRSGSTYMIDWENKLVKGSAIPGGEKPFEHINDSYSKNGEHFIDSIDNRLYIEFKDRSYIKTSPITNIRDDDTVTRVPVNIERKTPLATALTTESGFKYEIDWAAKTINGQRFETIENAPSEENNYNSFNAHVLNVYLENGETIYENVSGRQHIDFVTIDEFKQLEDKFREQEREPNGQVFHTLSGSTYILDRDKNVFYKEGDDKQYPMGEDGRVEFLNNGRAFVKVEGGHITTSPITRAESLSDYKRNLEREEMRGQDISRGRNDDLER